MITLRSHIEELLKKEPFLLENIKNGLINISALARKIEPAFVHKSRQKAEPQCNYHEYQTHGNRSAQ